jgi:hypothetical protein
MDQAITQWINSLAGSNAPLDSIMIMATNVGVPLLVALVVAQCKFEAGQVLLPREAPWLASYLDELLGFPNACHDDQVDSTSQALRYLSAKIAQGIPPRRPNPPRPPGTPRSRNNGR